MHLHNPNCKWSGRTWLVMVSVSLHTSLPAHARLTCPRKPNPPACGSAQSLLAPVILVALQIITTWVGAACRVAVKIMTKRFGPDGNLEPHFLRRIVHEVDILNHIGAPTPASLLLHSAHPLI